MKDIIWKGRECLNQETLEPSLELVGIYENVIKKVMIDLQEIEDYKLLTGKSLIEKKKKEISEKYFK